MSIPITIGHTYTGVGPSVTSVEASITAETELVFDDIIAAGAVNKEIDLPFTLSKVVAVMISAATPMTIKTNSTGSPQETITPPAIWAGVGTAPFAGDITKFYVNNPGTKAGRLQIRVALNNEI